MERDGSMNGVLLDLEQLSLEKGRPLDVDDLDDDGWLAASEKKKIVELGSLGEGAGGAVTRCILEGGKTVFALKVRPLSRTNGLAKTDRLDHHYRSESRRQETDPARIGLQQELRLRTYMSILRGLYGQVLEHNLHSHGVLRGRKS
jgi:hypothetical protein